MAKSFGLAATGLVLSASLALANGDSEELQLGAKLFADKRLSADGTVSCETCHDPGKAYADGRAVAIGIGGALGVRNTPSLTTTAVHKTFFWDGRRQTLEAQVLDPLLNPREHAVPSREALVEIVRGAKDYPQSFRRGVTAERIASALATYVRSLSESGGTRFDRWAAGDKKALSESERRGFEVFRAHGGCSSCHLLSEKSAPFTDDGFHSLGLVQRRLGADLGNVALRAATAGEAELATLISSDPQVSALGRFNVTKRPADIGKYRTPSLRNVAITAPYMHDGSIATLEEAVELEVYYRGIQQGHPVVLTPAERSDLVAFLRSLTSERFERIEGHQ